MGLGFFIAKTLLERSGAKLALQNRTFPQRGESDAEQPASELRGYIEDCVPPLDLAQRQKSQGYGRIHMSSRTLAPWRIDEPDRCAAHRDSNQQTAEHRAGNGLMQR